jgi:NAD+ synthase (glutamine-hydrolysing)
MRITTEAVDLELHRELCESLVAVRRRREFDAGAYIAAKVALICDYFEVHGLCGGLVALSGGVDSAVVAGLLGAARDNGGVDKVFGITLPAGSSVGAVDQDLSEAGAVSVARAFGIDLACVDISSHVEALAMAVDSAVGQVGEQWAVGQLVSYLRTPTLYYYTSLLTERGCPSVLCGTTNRDEGGYLGYFGKASDGMVDVQLIADLHKSEVYEVGRVLGVPESVLVREPSGDMFDGRVDTEVFGTSYDFVELYTELLCEPEWWPAMVAGWSDEARAQFDELGGRLERLHAFNKHKYLGASPAVHLDVIDALVGGGWKFQTWQR